MHKPRLFQFVLLVPILLLASCSSDPPISQQGSAVLRADPQNPSACLDLDSGAIGCGAGSDIQFVCSGGSMVFCVLQPVNGARAHPNGVGEPDYERCSNLVPDMSEGNIPEMAPGRSLCVLTDQGRLASIYIEAVDFVGSLQIRFTTWEPAVLDRWDTR